MLLRVKMITTAKMALKNRPLLLHDHLHPRKRIRLRPLINPKKKPRRKKMLQLSARLVQELLSNGLRSLFGKLNTPEGRILEDHLPNLRLAPNSARRVAKVRLPLKCSSLLLWRLVVNQLNHTRSQTEEAVVQKKIDAEALSRYQSLHRKIPRSFRQE